MPAFAWILLGLVLLIGEIIAAPGELFLLFLGIPALLIGLLLMAGVEIPYYAQFGIYALFSLALLAGLRGRLKARIQRRFAQNSEPLKGDTVTISTRIAPGATGRGELRGAVWSVRNTGAAELSPGQQVPVSACEGITLMVKGEPDHD